MRIGVDAIRWLLVAVNFLGVGLLGITGYNFFFGTARVETFRREDPRAYQIKQGRTAAPQASIAGWDPIITIVENQRPKPPGAKADEAAAEAEAAKEEEAVEGGPLDEKWELEMTLAHRVPAERVAYLAQRTTPRFTPGRTVSIGGRPVPRPTTPTRAGAPGGQNLLVYPGKTYELEEGGKTFDVVRIEEHKLVYRSDGKLYSLTIDKRPPEDILTPEDEDVAIKEAPRSKAQEPPPYDRGGILLPDGKVIGEEEETGGATTATATSIPGSAPGARPAIGPGSPGARPGSAPGVQKPSAADLKEFGKNMEKWRSNMTPEQRKKIDEAMGKAIQGKR
ncbi:MAG: hypothetical protein JXP34_07025 [Planctomycetes bacterium]|nr:hypothetical protein [Planctomycetota bacterium]